MLGARRNLLTECAIAVLSIAVTFGLTLIFLPLMQQSTLLLFLGAIFVNAHLNGRTAGLLATALSLCACGYLFLSSPVSGMSTGSRSGDAYSFGVFIIVAALVNWTTITRARAEEGRRKAERKYHDVFEYAITGIYQTTLDGRYLTANPMLACIFGYESPEAMLREVVGENNLNQRFYVEPGRRAEFARVVGERGVVTGFESEIYRADGSSVWISEHAVAIRDAGGELVGFQGTTIEITDRKQAEEALKKAYEELETRVAERTAELAQTNEVLTSEVTERERKEEELRRSREQLRALFARLQSIREEDRTRIAREIHDELGQTLTALMMDLSWLEDRLTKTHDAGRRALVEKTSSMTKLVDSTMDTVRKIAAELRPGVLDELGLKAAVEWQAAEFERRTNVRCRLDTDLEEVGIDRAIATAFFRILQESLTNITRHAHATFVRISLEEHDDDLVLRIEDDGRGITPTSLADLRSLGLLGMRERAGHLGGEVTIEGAANKGTVVTVRIPMCLPNKSLSSPPISVHANKGEG